MVDTLHTEHLDRLSEMVVEGDAEWLLDPTLDNLLDAGVYHTIEVDERGGVELQDYDEGQWEEYRDAMFPIWNTVWVTRDRDVAAAGESAGLTAFEVYRGHLGSAYWLGASSAGHSFRAAYFIPMYLILNPLPVTQGVRYGYL